MPVVSFTDYRPPTKDRNHGGSALRHGAAHRPQALECAIQIVGPGSYVLALSPNELIVKVPLVCCTHCYFCKMDADTIDDGPGSPRVALGCDTQPPNHSWRQAKTWR